MQRDRKNEYESILADFQNAHQSQISTKRSIRPEVFFLENAQETSDVKKISLRKFLTTHKDVKNYFDFKELYDQESHYRLSLVPSEDTGAVAFFPLLDAVVRYPTSEVLYSVRTASNRGLTSQTLQEKIQKFRVVVVGMSVGASIISGLLAKGYRNITAYDQDIVSPANMNRLPLGMIPGFLKAELLTHYATLLDPFGNFHFHSENLNETNIQNVFESNTPQVIIDECDNSQTKELIRVYAKKHRVPVISAADIGTGCVHFSFEDFQHNLNLEMFRNVIDRSGLTKSEWDNYSPVQKILLSIGLEHAPADMLDALQMIASGKLLGFPQEVSAVCTAAAGVLCMIENLIEGKSIRPVTVLTLPLLFSEEQINEFERQQSIDAVRKLFFK